MTEHRNAALKYFQDHRQETLAKMKELIAIPSVSTDPEHKEDIQNAAKWLEKELQDLGMTRVEIFPTPRHPIVYGENLNAGEDKPTALIYGHYDVQPEDPIQEWKTDPFTPTEVGEDLFARGSSDMKGQVIACISAVDAIMKTGALPINIKFLIEGEEEIGGSYLEGFIKENTDLLSCDFFLNPDTGMLGADIPTITYALRGIAYFELRVQGPKQDLHSGTFGGVIHNPAQVMTDLLSGLHDDQGRITLRAFTIKFFRLKQRNGTSSAACPWGMSSILIRQEFPSYGERKDTPLWKGQVPGQLWKLMGCILVSLEKGKRLFYLPTQWLKFQPD